jgi:hypothetical protein
MIVTIFGSCRQVMPSEFISTSIQNNLTYPHYSKEVLQAIKFCKNLFDIPSIITKSIFRTGILENKLLYSEDFIKEFNKTDIFIIEIASRICYDYKGFYAHHIISEPSYNTGINDLDSLKIYDLTDEEIEKDIIEIKNLIYPKPLILCGHIYTRKYGKRYELILLLKRLSNKYAIPFFDPVEQLAGIELSDAFNLQENVLAHFTDYGKKIISERYRHFILDIFSTNTPCQ